MKKTIATLAFLASGLAYAGSASVEYQNVDGVNGTANSNLYQLSISENLNKNFVVGATLNTSESATTGGTTGSRAEVNLLGRTSLGVTRPGLKIATGQRFTTTGNFSYYSIEPSVVIPVPSTKLSTELGWRYRNAYDSAANADETRTWRAGIKYNLSKEHTVGLRYDNVRGDTNQNVVAVNYTRNF
jgi:hypothetical protein